MGCGGGASTLECSLFSARLGLGSWEEINLKDSPLPYLLRFDILKLSFGCKCLNLFSLLLLTNVYYWIPKKSAIKLLLP